ncbi:nitroreductase family deazaflavin-dependent oxidoreductase [Protofrankia coriariae]|uniref:Nitroreductase n=1 Tax=Protofrankia coriariae TaxID=1562887 RepID=A0ABR5F6V5_9ACTN|nr:nitroreductase family deazaflavin-dependent oxidoreductase [Protofrankia coriariae]KLL12405.1 nitroreductase [Protofrankia coriariae]
MPLPRWIASANRRATNRVTGPAATRLPGFGVIVHRGRQSGREYRTPVNVFGSDGGYVVALTYGSDSDWVRNVLAAGGCVLEHRNHREELGSPHIVHDDSRSQVPAPLRPVLGAIGVSDFLTLRPQPAPPQPSAEEDVTI